ncbi:MAG TPA: TadE/TadG family type IV pilus assembly protein [Candidatus Dormibacteraeota bacterium]|nr:TadE/TadG family type IV pilus assembly protein [Candidatus Dormibacteraeota bacterium]
MRNSLHAASGYRSPGRRGERGADVFEAALVLPIVLTLFLGMIVLARGWDIYQSMTRAAREGVRQAVTTSCATCGNSYEPDSNIQNDIVFPALKAVGINTSDPTLTSSYAQGYAWLDTSQQVCGAYITFQYPYTIKLPFIPINLGTVDLTTRVQMRLENEDGSCPP